MRTLLALLALLLLPALAQAGDTLELGPLSVTLPGTDLVVKSSSDGHSEVKDSKTGWTWRVESVGDGGMQVYPEPDSVKATIVRRDELLDPTDLALVPMAGALGSLFGARTKTHSVRTCFLGRAGSLWLLTVQSSRAVIEQSEAKLRQACQDAVFPGLPEASGASLVGLTFDPRVPVDWQPMDPPGPRSVQAAFNQSATGLTGIVTRQPREGHPYDTNDVADLQRQLSGQGFRVRVSEVMRAAGQDAPRVEVGRPAAHGAESDWLVAIVRGERSLWTIQSPTRGLSYTKLKRLYDLALGKARLNDD